MAGLQIDLCRQALTDQLADQHGQAPLPLARQVLPPDLPLPRIAHGGSLSI
jgi:hypothetical protein